MLRAHHAGARRRPCAPLVRLQFSRLSLVSNFLSVLRLEGKWSVVAVLDEEVIYRLV